MKKQKFLVVILSVLLILPILVLPASAAIGTARVNADYSAITWGGHNYYRVDGSDINYINDSDSINDLALDKYEYEYVHSVQANANEYVIELIISYVEGGYVTYYYVRDDKIDEYRETLANGSDTFSVYLGYGYEIESMTVSRSVLYANPTTMHGYEIARYSNYSYVEYSALDESISLSNRGFIFKDKDNSFYFVDEYQFGTGAERFTPIIERDTVTVYKITDEKLLRALTQGYDIDSDIIYTDSPIGIFVFSLIVFAILLGVIPLAISIVTFILGFFAKKGYKKFLFTVSALCLLAAAVTLITVILCILFFIF